MTVVVSQTGATGLPMVRPISSTSHPIRSSPYPIPQYTLANYKFAQWVEPDNAALQEVSATQYRQDHGQPIDRINNRTTHSTP